MDHKKIIDSKSSSGLPVSAVDYLCYMNVRYAFQEIRYWLGDNRFLEFLEVFSGSYMFIPTRKRIENTFFDYFAAMAVKKAKESRKAKNMLEWNAQESILYSIAKKTKRTYKSVYEQGVKVLREMEKIQKWTKGMKVWEQRYLKKEDDKYDLGS